MATTQPSAAQPLVTPKTGIITSAWLQYLAGLGAGGGVAGVASFNTRAGAVTLNSADVTAALGFTPYSAANPSGFISGITGVMVTTALGFTPYSAANPNGYISGITGGMVTGALGFTPIGPNLTGPITSLGNATAVAAQTGTGSTFVMKTAPAMTGRVNIEGASEVFAIGLKFSPTGGPVYFGASDNTGTPGWQISSAGGGALVQGTASGNVGIGLSPSYGLQLVSSKQLVANPSYANVRAYGAVGDGIADDTTAIQNAFNDTTYAAVYFPKGIYRITSALTSASKDLRLFGDGPSASVIKVDGAINGVTFTGARASYDIDQLVIENLAFLSNNTGALAAVQATWTASATLVQPRTFHARNVMVSGLSGDSSFLRGFYLAGADNASIQHCYITTFEFLSGIFRAGSAGIEMISTASMGGFESDITDCTFLQCATGIKYNADATATNNNCQGLFVNHCHIINCQTCVLAGNTAAVPGGTTIEPEVKIHQCFLDAQNTAVDIQAQSQISITDNLFYNAPGIPNSIGVKITSVNAGGYQVDGVICGNTFINLGAGGTTLGISIVGNAGAHESILIDANTFEAMTNAALFDVNTDGAHYTYSNLVISGGSVSNLGTGNFVGLVSNSPTEGVGYATGAGGTVTQLTSKATAVTLSKTCGEITMNAAALAAATIVSFTLTNTSIAATDLMILNHVTTGTKGAYTLNAQCEAGSATISVRNNTAGSLSEAIVIRFALVRGVTA